MGSAACRKKLPYRHDLPDAPAKEPVCGVHAQSENPGNACGVYADTSADGASDVFMNSLCPALSYPPLTRSLRKSCPKAAWYYFVKIGCNQKENFRNFSVFSRARRSLGIFAENMTNLFIRSYYSTSFLIFQEVSGEL